MTAQVIAFPAAATVEPAGPRFDPESASEAELRIWRDGIRTVVDDLAPLLPTLRRIAAQHGLRLGPHLTTVS